MRDKSVDLNPGFLSPLQGKKGRPGEDGAPGQKGQKVCVFDGHMSP